MSDGLLAGFAELNITPPLGISLQGALHDRKATDVHDDLYAKAVVLDDGSNPIAIVALDVIAILDEDAAELRRLVAEHTHLEAESIMVACTHTHTGPAMMNMAGITRDKSYCDWLVKKAADSVRLAVNRLQPARIASGVGHEDGLSFCRRFKMTDGTVRMNPGRGNPDALYPTGRTDPDVGVLYVESVTGEPLGAVVNFCLHYVGTDGSLEISADYFGHFAAVMRRIKGEQFTALLLNGAQGHINNIDINDPEQQGGHAQAIRVAETLAGEVIRVIGRMRPSPDVTLASACSPVRVRRKEVTEEDVELARRILAAAEPKEVDAPFSWLVGHPLPPTLRPVYAVESIEVAQMPQELQTEVQVLRVGETALASLPGEFFPEIGLGIKAGSTAANTFVIGLANGFVGYVPTDKALKEEGGYETWTSRWSLPDVGAETLFTEASTDLIKRLFGDEAVRSA